MLDRSRSLLLRWFPAILLITLIFLISATPDYDLPTFGWLDFVAKKGGHMVGYFLLALAFTRGMGNLDRKSLLLVLTFSLLYSISDEIHQTFVPGRHPAVMDVLIDMTGSLVAVCALRRCIMVQRCVFAGIESPLPPF